MRRLKIIILGSLISVALIGALSCNGGTGGWGPPGQLVPYQDINFTVQPSTHYSMTVNMNSGAIFEGYLTVRGGNDDIRFYIKDSYGNVVLDINRVQGRYDFSYQATTEGFHTIYFDNTFSWITSKEAYLHYRVR